MDYLNKDYIISREELDVIYVKSDIFKILDLKSLATKDFVIDGPNFIDVQQEKREDIMLEDLIKSAKKAYDNRDLLDGHKMEFKLIHFIYYLCNTRNFKFRSVPKENIIEIIKEVVFEYLEKYIEIKP